MKKALFILTVFFISIYGCKKKDNQPGSAYTKLLAGTREYNYTNAVTWGNTTTTTTDTTSVTIQYINDDTIAIGTVHLIYVPANSTDSSIFYKYQDNYIRAILYTLTFNPNTNSIQYIISNYPSPGGGTQTTYTSL